MTGVHLSRRLAVFGPIVAASLMIAGLAGAPAFGGANETAAVGYDAARWDPIHFKPDIDQASDEQCLACHAEVLEPTVREVSPAGVKAADSLAWYQTLDTYDGAQDGFHRRHIESTLAKAVMKLNCTFCHQGNDPREEAGPPAMTFTGDPPFTLRKMVNPSQTCLRCHGRFPFEVMAGLEGSWAVDRANFEDESTPNGCLACHEFIRTERHRVTYLDADAIEEMGSKGSDVCYGCHGGRSWYRISFPYPRHPWPDMDEEIPDWAKDRPTESDPRFRLVVE